MCIACQIAMTIIYLLGIENFTKPEENLVEIIIARLILCWFMCVREVPNYIDSIKMLVILRDI